MTLKVKLAHYPFEASEPTLLSDHTPETFESLARRLKSEGIDGGVVPEGFESSFQGDG